MASSNEYAASNRTRILLAVAVVLLIGLLVALLMVFYKMIRPAGAPEADTTPDDMVWVRSIYGFGPAVDEQLKSPSSVAVAPNGDIYATDPTRARVMVFRPDGTFKRLIHTAGGGTTKGMFIRPESIDVDDAGLLYIADSWAKKIIVFDSAGRFVREWPTEQQARGVNVVGDKVYVLDVGRVLIFDKQGKLLSAYGQRGPAPGMIDAYQGITARAGTVFVAESFNKRLQTFDQRGKSVWAVPGGVAGRGGPSSRKSSGLDESASKAVPNHRWDLPQDLIFDAMGRLVVVDAFQFELAVVDPKTGKVQASYGEYGHNDGQFYYPTSIDYDPQRDWFAVADTGNNRIQIVRVPGSSNPNAAVLWRALSSPYRYLALPLFLLVLALLIAAVSAWRLRRRARTRAAL